MRYLLVRFDCGDAAFAPKGCKIMTKEEWEKYKVEIMKSLRKNIPSCTLGDDYLMSAFTIDEINTAERDFFGKNEIR